MLAALPMYDLPELRPETDAFWAGLALALRRNGVAAVPATLTRGMPLDRLWSATDLSFAQTCGYPLSFAHRADLALVATPVYRAEGCDGAFYRSRIVVRAEIEVAEFGDLAGLTVAINGHDSQSGCNVLRALAAPLAVDGRFFGRVIVTGAHANSLIALRSAEADVAAIDCVTWALLERVRPQAIAGLYTLCFSAPAPALPYVTAAHATSDQIDRIAAALAETLADPALAEVRRALLIDGIERLPLTAYAVIPAMRRGALLRGYRELD